MSGKKTTLEDAIAIVKASSGGFDLLNHMGDLIAGLDEAAHRLRALEAAAIRKIEDAGSDRMVVTLANGQRVVVPKAIDPAPTAAGAVQ